MYNCFLIHSSADGHLGCFYVLAIINSAVMNIVSQQSCVSSSLAFCMMYSTYKLNKQGDNIEPNKECTAT